MWPPIPARPMSIALELLVIVGLTLVNAFFAGAEIAILSVRKTRLRELADEGHAGARITLRLRDDPERFLATVQIGVTVAGATAGAFGGAVLAMPLQVLLRGVGVSPNAAENVAFASVVAVVSVLSVVVGELVPKSLALRYAEPAALVVGRPLWVLSLLARPLVWFLTAASNVVLRPFKDQTTFTEARLSPEELQQLVDEAAAAGTMDRDTGEIASRAIELSKLKAFSVMLPRSEIVWLPLSATRADVERLLREHPHARYPVLDDAQQPVGYVVAHELFPQLLEKKLDIVGLLREIPTFPEPAAAASVLRMLQRARTEIGLVVDETGFPTGLVSIEALAEELFGEIVSEHEHAEPRLVAREDGTHDVRGDTPLHEVNRELGLELPIEPAAATMGGLVVDRHGGFPSAGTRVDLGEGVEAEVLESTPRRVLRVKLRIARPTAP